MVGNVTKFAGICTTKMVNEFRSIVGGGSAKGVRECEYIQKPIRNSILNHAFYNHKRKIMALGT